MCIPNPEPICQICTEIWFLATLRIKLYYFENIIILIILCLTQTEKNYLYQTRYEPFWRLFPFKIGLTELITQYTSSHIMKSTTQYPDWLIVYCLLFRWRVFHSYRNVTIASERLQNLGFSRPLQPLNMEGSLSCHACYDTGPHPKNCTRLVAF